MNKVIGFYESTIGKKVLVAVTGIVLFGFVVGHMVGNLKAFLGTDAATGIHHLDLYANFLREMGQEVMGRTTLLWILRLGLLAALIVHIVTIVQLRAVNRRSRPEGYKHPYQYNSLLPARAMIWSGVFLAFFIVYHLLHLTFGVLHFDGFVEGRVYHNVYTTFGHLWVVLIYVLAVFFLGLHLFHGVWSLFQTLGLDNPDRNRVLRGLAAASAIVLFVGFALVPVAFGIGAMPRPPEKFVQEH